MIRLSVEYQSIFHLVFWNIERLTDKYMMKEVCFFQDIYCHVIIQMSLWLWKKWKWEKHLKKPCVKYLPSKHSVAFNINLRWIFMCTFSLIFLFKILHNGYIQEFQQVFCDRFPCTIVPLPPLLSKDTPYQRPDFKCQEIVNMTKLSLLKRDHFFIAE